MKTNVTAKGINTAALHSNTANQKCEETAEYRNNDLNPKDYSPLVLVEAENGDGNWTEAKCFLYTGSNSSLVRMKFARQSRLQGSGPCSAQFGIAGGAVHYEQAEEFDIRIHPLKEEKSYLVKTTGIKKPCFNVKPIPQNIFSEHKHLQEVKDKIYVGGGEVDLLIGLDYAPLILPEKALRAEEDPDGSPSVALTHLGCYLFGGLIESSQQTVRHILKINHISKLEQEDLKSFFMETSWR